MRTLSVALLIAAVCLMPGCKYGGRGGESCVRAGFDFSTMDLIAVVDVGGAVESESVKDQIADSFLRQLLKKGYGPVGRQLVKRQLQESNAQIDDLKGEAYAIEAGRVLKVPAVLTIQVPNFGEETSLTAKIIEVNTGGALWVGSGAVPKRHASWWSSSDAEFEGALGGGIFNAGQGQYANSEEQKKKEQQRKAQRILTVREAKDIDAVVAEICKSLPYKLPDLKPHGSFIRMPRLSNSK
jgi:hypothetical protein